MGMNISPAWEGFLRAIGFMLLLAILGFLSITSNDVVFGSAAPYIAAAALWLEGIVKGNTGNGLFGLAKSS